MVVCHIRKIIFIHIPKTAGSSIEHLLRDEGKYELDFIGVRNGRSTHHYMGIELKMNMNQKILLKKIVLKLLEQIILRMIVIINLNQ